MSLCVCVCVALGTHFHLLCGCCSLPVAKKKGKAKILSPALLGASMTNTAQSANASIETHALVTLFASSAERTKVSLGARARAHKLAQ